MAVSTVRSILGIVLPVSHRQQASATSSEGETPFFLIVSGFSLFIYTFKNTPKHQVSHHSPRPGCHEHIFTVYYLNITADNTL